MSSVVQAYNPPGTSSNTVYAWIKDNLEAILDQAIVIRRAG